MQRSEQYHYNGRRSRPTNGSAIVPSVTAGPAVSYERNDGLSDGKRSDARGDPGRMEAAKAGPILGRTCRCSSFRLTSSNMMSIPVVRGRWEERSVGKEGVSKCR